MRPGNCPACGYFWLLEVTWLMEVAVSWKPHCHATGELPCLRLLLVTSSYLAGGGRRVLEAPLPCGGGVGQSGQGGGHGDSNGTGQGSGSLKGGEGGGRGQAEEVEEEEHQ